MRDPAAGEAEGLFESYLPMARRWSRAGAVGLALRIGAVICGDEGEIHDLQTGKVIDG